MKRARIDQSKLKSLINELRSVGSPNPRAAALSEMTEGIPQLAHACAARLFWNAIVDEANEAWIERQISYAERSPSGPGAGAGAALRSLLSKGATRQELTELIRWMQFEVVHSFACAIGGVSGVNLPYRNFTLVASRGVDDEAVIVSGLHEILLGFDPTGRELRPKPSKRPSQRPREVANKRATKRSRRR